MNWERVEHVFTTDFHPHYLSWAMVDGAPVPSLIEVPEAVKVSEVTVTTGSPRLFPESLKSFIEHARSVDADTLTIDGDTRTVEEWELELPADWERMDTL